METKFIVNDYILIWNLLFQSSGSEILSKLKEKLWDTYKKEYNQTYKDKLSIMKDYKNFIPDDDTIYNAVLDNKYYEKIRKQAEKYRLEIMKLWDKNKKETVNLFENIVRIKVPNYNFFIVNKELRIIDHPLPGCMTIGKQINPKYPHNLLYEITMTIIMNSIKIYNGEDKLFKRAIVELAVLNEYATNLNKRSYYLSGDPELLSLKRWLYPYWLMYLGTPKEELNNCMVRDRISFDLKKYPYEKELRKMNLEQFIDFCIRNKKYIVREQIR